MDLAIRQAPAGHQVVPRADLDFKLHSDIPRYWFGGDAFKTRFFDAMSLLFPEGERYFIECVRDYRDQITDPVLREQVKHFIFQEGQHGMQHNRFNERLAEQGVAVDRILDFNVRALRFFRTWLPKQLTLAHTSAVEHITAIMAHGFLRNKETFAEADVRLRAMYIWHGIEEIEHKAVAYDVMKKVAKVNYFVRVFAFCWASVLFPFYTFRIMNHMFKVDGLRNRGGVWLRGLWWLYGPRGVFTRLLPHYFAYFLPGFHPWQAGEMEDFQRWQQVYRETGSPIAAAEAVSLPQPAGKRALIA